MKKSLKIGIIVVASLLGLVLIASLLVSPIAKSYIEKHDKELCGREVNMDKLRVNIFNGKVTIAGFRMLEADDKTTFVTFDSLKVNANLWRLLAHEICIEEIRLISPNVTVLQNEDWFNFNDIIEHFASEEEEEEPNDNPFAIAINNITLHNGRIYYADQAVKSHFDLKDLNLYIPGVYFAGNNTDIGLDLNFADGGSLKTKLLYNLEEGSFNINLLLNRFSIAAIQPYLQSSMNIDQLNGKLSANMNIKGNANHVMELSLKGNATLNDFATTDLAGNELAKAQKLYVAIEQIDLAKNQIFLDSVAASGLALNVELLKDGSNTFSHLFKEDTTQQTDTTPAADETPMDFRIKSFNINNTTFHFADNTLKTPFVYNITDINVHADNVSLNHNMQLKANATLPSKGMFDFEWKGNLEDLANQHILVNIRNLYLPDLSPYTIEYTAYPLKKGNLTFKSINSIRNNHLTSENLLDIFKCEADKKLANMKPEYNIPLKTILYILKDRNDKISFNLPVSGNIDSPEFSYKKIIINTLLNLTVKVAASPFDALSSSFGLSKEQEPRLAFATLRQDLTSEHYTMLDKVAAMLEEKPECVLVLKPTLNQQNSKQRMATFLAKEAFYKTRNPNAQPSLETFKAIEAISEKDADFVAFLNSATGNAGKTTAEKALALSNEEQINAAITAQTNQKLNAVKEYLVNHHHINAARVESNAPTETEAKNDLVIDFGIDLAEEENQ